MPSLCDCDRKTTLKYSSLKLEGEEEAEEEGKGEYEKEKKIYSWNSEMKEKGVVEKYSVVSSIYFHSLPHSGNVKVRERERD